MRKIRKISFFRILGLLTVVLFLASISFMQAQVQAKGKPDKPPGKPDKPDEEEATWAVQLPILGSGTSTMLYGDQEGNYYDQDDNIEVKVEKKSPGAYHRDNDFVTSIFFKIANPTESYRHVDFEDVLLSKLEEGDYDCVEPDYGLPCCVFPGQDDWQGSCNDCSIDCMQDFLNDEFHPYRDDEDSTYRYFIIELLAFDKDILTMESDETYLLGQYGHYHDYFEMRLLYQTQDREPTYHNILCRKSAHLGEASAHPFNIWITRTDENTWKVEVGTVDSQQFLFLEEYYYDAIKRGKNYKLTGWYSTLFAEGEFHFTFDLIRIPPSS